MCGFIITTKRIADLASVNEKVKHRGPDDLRVATYNKITFVHNLLHLTGEKTLQPINENNVVACFNGEIYNYKDINESAVSDIYSIITAYDEGQDPGWAARLDGEFALCLFDFSKGLAFLATDTFGIKPLFFCVENGDLGIASYSSALRALGFNDIQRLEPNTLLKLNIKTLEIVEKKEIYSFDLRQFKGSFDGWSSAFIEASRKRALNVSHDIILPLSSGLDSGAVACALNLIGARHNTFSIKGSELANIIQERIKVSKADNCFFHQRPEPELLSEAKAIISNTAEDFFYGKDYKSANKTGKNDTGAQGFSYILHATKKKLPNLKVLLSGLGGDEIMTRNQNYKFGRANPAVFPEDLSTVFPWDNFYYGAASSYLGMCENVSGAHGIEGRYPFFDRKLVQEFLNLTPSLKNKEEKAPIVNFLKEHQYPFTMQKKGFSI